MKPKIDDTLVKDCLGNAALIRAETKTVLIVSDFNKHIKRKVDVYYISSKIPKPNPTLKEEIKASVSEIKQIPSLPMLGRLTDLAGKWNGEDKPKET